MPKKRIVRRRRNRTVRKVRKVRRVGHRKFVSANGAQSLNVQFPRLPRWVRKYAPVVIVLFALWWLYSNFGRSLLSSYAPTAKVGNVVGDVVDFATKGLSIVALLLLAAGIVVGLIWLNNRLKSLQPRQPVKTTHHPAATPNRATPRNEPDPDDMEEILGTGGFVVGDMPDFSGELNASCTVKGDDENGWYVQTHPELFTDRDRRTLHKFLKEDQQANGPIQRVSGTRFYRKENRGKGGIFDKYAQQHLRRQMAKALIDARNIGAPGATMGDLTEPSEYF